MPTEQRLARRGALVVAFGAAFSLLQRDGVAGQVLSSAADLAEAETRRAAQRAELCGAGNAAAVGLRGEYFADEQLRGRALLVRLDAVIDFDAKFDWPADRGKERPHSVRWTGWIRPPISGGYRFHVAAPNSRVLIARQIVADSDASLAVKVDMSAGKYYPIAVELQRLGDGPQRMRLEWTAPHGARYVIPRALLYPPSETAAGARPG